MPSGNAPDTLRMQQGRCSRGHANNRPPRRRTDAPASAWVSHLFLGLGAAGIAAYFLVGSFGQKLVWDAIGYSAVAAIVVATRLRRPAAAPPGPCSPPASSATSRATRSTAPTSSSPATKSRPPVLLGRLLPLELLPARRRGARLHAAPRRALSLPDLTDAGVYATGVALLAWGPVFDAQVHQHGLSALGHAVLLMYPAGDIVVLALFSLLARPGRLAADVGSPGRRRARLVPRRRRPLLVVVRLLHARLRRRRGLAVRVRALRSGRDPPERAGHRSDRGPLLHAAWSRVGLVAAIGVAIGVIFYDVAAGESLSWGEAGLAPS